MPPSCPRVTAIPGPEANHDSTTEPDSWASNPTEQAFLIGDEHNTVRLIAWYDETFQNYNADILGRGSISPPAIARRNGAHANGGKKV